MPACSNMAQADLDHRIKGPKGTKGDIPKSRGPKGTSLNLDGTCGIWVNCED